MPHTRSLFFAAVASLLILTVFAPPLRAQDPAPGGSDPHATGLRPPTATEARWMDENLAPVRGVRLNALALGRLNRDRLSRGLAPLTLTPAAADEEVVTGADDDDDNGGGSAAPAAAVSSATVGALPAAVDNSTLPCFPPIRSQGQVGSCAAFSSTYYMATHMTGLARGWNNKNDADNTTKFSPKWTYNMVNGGGDHGSWFSEIYAMLLNNGAATWADFPYSGTAAPGSYLPWSVDPAVWRHAVGYRMNQGGVVDLDTASGLSTAKGLLANGYVLNYATFINSWQYSLIVNDPATANDDAQVGKAVCTYERNDQNGGHAMTIVGYNDDLWVDLNKNGSVDPGEKGALRIANSWGTYWTPDGAHNDGGFTWVAYDALRATSAVSGVSNAGRQAIFAFPGRGNYLYYLTARASYTPTLLGQFTLNHARRAQLNVHLGVSATSATTPATLADSGALVQQGGGLAFDGSLSAIDGSFVFDLTDLATAGATRRYYLAVQDRASGSPAGVSAFRLTDAAGNPLGGSAAGVPGSADNRTLLAYVDYGLNAPVINSVNSATGRVGTAFTYNITASGSPTSYGAANLPAGLSVNASTGAITGTPTQAGSFAVSLSASNAGGTGSANLALTVSGSTAAAPVITSSPAVSATVGAAFSYAITADNSPTSFGQSGSLPPGVAFNSASGTLAGTPTQAGVYTLTITAANAGGTGQKTLTITVTASAANVPVITSATTATASVNSPFTYRITATNGPTRYSAAGLPDGLALDAATGRITGAVALARQTVVTLGAANGTGTGYATLVLTVEGDSSFGPANDRFANRTTLASAAAFTIQGDNTNATAETGEPAHAGQPARRSVWYAWTAPANGPVSLSTAGSAFDTLLAVYKGATVGALTAVASNDDSAAAFTSALTFTADIGATYLIAVDGYGGEAGSLSLTLALTAQGGAPANDSFAARAALSGPSFTASGFNFNATAEAGEPAHAGQAAAHSVWWTWTAPSTGTLTLETTGSGFDTVLAVYTGSAVGGLAAVASDDQGGENNTSKTTFPVTAGTVYQFAVDGFGGAVGGIALKGELGGAAVNNDLFANAAPLTGAAASATASNAAATAETGEPAHNGNLAAKSLWWTWTAPSVGRLTVGTVGSNFDTVLAVYTGTSLSTLAELASDDDSGGNGASLVTLPVAAGTTYRIAVDGYDGASGSVALRLSFASENAVPANDRFANRLALGSDATFAALGYNTNATVETGEPDHAGQAASRSVWYAWTAPTSGSVSVSTSGSDFDTVLAVYAGTSLGALTPIASNDDSGEGTASALTFTAAAGTTYLLAVDGYSGSTGEISLSGVLEDHASLYETDFESFTPGLGTLTQADDWTSYQTGGNAQGIIESAFDDGGQAAYLGFNAPLGDFASVWRPLDFDPVGAGLPAVTFSVRLDVADSTNGIYDKFYVSVLNRAGDFLAAIGFDNRDLTITYEGGGSQVTDTGVTFDNNTAYLLTAQIDFAHNTWSATLGDQTLFRNVPLHTAGNDLDLGNVSLDWKLLGSTPGNNFLVFDDYSVRAAAAAVAPAITAPPQSITAPPGGVAVFTVAASGSGPLNYQWQRNGADVPGAAAASLALSNLDAGLAGAYTVTVSNPAGTVTSAPASLTVAAGLPTILTQPVSSGAKPGGSVTFGVSAAGAAPLSYQWRFNGTPLDGETGANLTLSGITPAQAGAYTVALSNPAGSLLSDVAMLTVKERPADGSPVISSEATAQGRTGQAFQYQITASGSPTSYAATGLPLGLQVAAGSGLISGTPTAEGTFAVALSATNAQGTGTAALTLTITASAPSVSVAADRAAASALTGAKGRFQLMRSGGDLSQPLTVTFVLKGSGQNGTDYAPQTLTRTIKAGKSSQKVVISPRGDGRGKAVRAVKLKLQPGNGYQVGTPSGAKVKIFYAQ